MGSHTAPHGATHGSRRQEQHTAHRKPQAARSLDSHTIGRYKRAHAHTADRPHVWTMPGSLIRARYAYTRAPIARSANSGSLIKITSLRTHAGAVSKHTRSPGSRPYYSRTSESTHTDRNRQDTVHTSHFCRIRHTRPHTRRLPGSRRLY